jgi:ubiquinone/menaquinone biosynthesis C-methylase UbiE
VKLDVGCGHHPTGDVNVDLLVPESDLRWNQDVSGIPNFVKATSEYLPFKDGCFEEVYCAHLLEHFDDPNPTIKELFRVSSKVVKLTVPFALFSISDFFLYLGKKFLVRKEWMKHHHRKYYWFHPFKFGTTRMVFINLKEALLYQEKAYGSHIKIPIPFETTTEVFK